MELALRLLRQERAAFHIDILLWYKLTVHIRESLKGMKGHRRSNVGMYVLFDDAQQSKIKKPSPQHGRGMRLLPWFILSVRPRRSLVFANLVKSEVGRFGFRVFGVWQKRSKHPH